MLPSEKLRIAKETLADKLSGFIPEVGITLGSGLGFLIDKLEGVSSCAYSEIPYFPESKVAGHSNRLWWGRLGNTNVVIMQGRVHLYEGFTAEEVVFPTRLMITLGARTLILTHAVGGINKEYKSGDFVVDTDHIAWHMPDPLQGDNDPGLGSRFVALDKVYDPTLINIAVEAAAEEKVVLHKGVSVFKSGPCFETAAEIEAMRRLGADVATMSTIPEIIAAAHMGAKVLGIAFVSNMGAGILKEAVNHDAVLANAHSAKDNFARLMQRIAEKITT